MAYSLYNESQANLREVFKKLGKSFKVNAPTVGEQTLIDNLETAFGVAYPYLSWRLANPFRPGVKMYRIARLVDDAVVGAPVAGFKTAYDALIAGVQEKRLLGTF